MRKSSCWCLRSTVDGLFHHVLEEPPTCIRAECGTSLLASADAAQHRWAQKKLARLLPWLSQQEISNRKFEDNIITQKMRENLKMVVN